MKRKSQLDHFQARQGDVLIEEITPQEWARHIAGEVTFDRPQHGRIILAHGEVTGHHHSIDARAADWWKGAGLEQYGKVYHPTALIHQEHGPIPLAPTEYRAVRQREYHPEEIRHVAD